MYIILVLIHKVLWTGGWDSTFRVLDLILNKKTTVQPFYIFDENRLSTKMELYTMDLIKKMVANLDTELAENLLETQYINMVDIPTNSDITEAYEILAKQSHLGNQYDWLARYCDYNNITNIELCIHKDDTVEGFINKDVKLINTEIDHYYVLKEKPSQEELKIFSYFHYPLFKFSKLDMEQKATESCFQHIMEETWFCHSPINNKPCGMCNPCKYTREEGLGRRVPNPTNKIKLQRKIQKKSKSLKKKLFLK